MTGCNQLTPSSDAVHIVCYYTAADAAAGLCVLVTMAPIGALAVWLGVEPVPVMPPWPTVRLLVLNGVVRHAARRCND